jgi:hypothetical protein
MPGAYVEANLPLMIAESTAEPNAPPIARAENARPVAVDRYAWGAVNCMSATRRESGPDCPMPPYSMVSEWRYFSFDTAY